MEYFFNKYAEFIANDVRTDRNVSKLVAETYSNRHEAALPQELIEGKSVLDLGSCIGATGAWCLAHGALHYTGVEAQQSAVDKSNELLSKHWDDETFNVHWDDIIHYLDEHIALGKKFDIVTVFGVVYGYVDYYSLLSKVAKIAKEYIVIDCQYPRQYEPGHHIVHFTTGQHFHVDGDTSLNYTGLGAKLSPEAMRLVMQTLGWDNNGKLIYPKPVDDECKFDLYLTSIKNDNLDLPTRYLTMFEKATNKKAAVSDNVALNNRDSLVHDKRQLKTPDIKAWEFDDAVAKRFQEEAEKHIPDYHNVIDLSYKVIAGIYPNRDAKILDVGSALGHTIKYFDDKGYNETYGVEKSSSMLKYTEYPHRVYYRDTLPDLMWDAILANWTLHFINRREEYLYKIYESLNPGGVLMLTDKMSSTPEIDDLYYNFKRDNGVSDKEIQEKKEALKNVLVPKPLRWYMDTLTSLGFADVQVVNTKFMFSTIYARKPN